jgi:dynein heavy chain
MTAFDKDNLHIIFTNLVTWWLHKFTYSQNISKLGKSLVAATLDVYERVQQQLLPTPTKSHYTFNLRDVSKVFQVAIKHAHHHLFLQHGRTPWDECLLVQQHA